MLCRICRDLSPACLIQGAPVRSTTSEAHAGRHEREAASRLVLLNQPKLLRKDRIAREFSIQIGKQRLGALRLMFALVGQSQ